MISGAGLRLSDEHVSVYFAEGDSKNYLTYYKRAAVFLALGKSKSALPDLTRAIELKPDFLAVSENVFVFSARSQNAHSVVTLPGPAAERKHPVEAGEHGGGQGGLWVGGELGGRLPPSLWEQNSLKKRLNVALQLDRSPEHEEAREQLMKASELEGLQEEAYAAHHQGDYSATIAVLERAIEVDKRGMKFTLKLSLDLLFLFAPHWVFSINRIFFIVSKLP